MVLLAAYIQIRSDQPRDETSNLIDLERYLLILTFLVKVLRGSPPRKVV